jgi:Sulfotransferase family
MTPVRVLFLGGLGRSGTTLLERVIGELPGAFPLGEIVHLWIRDIQDDERCGCNKPFSGCPFWTQVGERAFGGWANVDVDRVRHLAAAVDRTRFIPRHMIRRLSAQVRADLAEYNSYYVRVYRAAQEVSGASVLIDSSKHSSLAYCLSFEPEIDLRVLHVVRDSRGCAYSWTKHVERPETDGADEMARFTPTQTAMLWNAHNVAFSVLGRASTAAVRRLRYEEFVADPLATVASIAQFAGLDLPAGSLDFMTPDQVELGTCHSAAGNPMRFVTGTLAMRRDDAWRASFPAGQRRLVSALTAPLLAAYGYPLTVRSR